MAAELKHRWYMKQYQRKRRDAARRGDASALAALQNYRLKANEYQRKRRDALRKHAVVDVELREAGKDGKQTKFRGMGALKEACKVVQPRLCQASPDNAQVHSQIAEASSGSRASSPPAQESATSSVDNQKAVRQKAVRQKAVRVEGCPPDILQRGKFSREYRKWYMEQYKQQPDVKQRQKLYQKLYYKRRVAKENAVVDVGPGAAVAAGKMKDNGGASAAPRLTAGPHVLAIT